MCLFHKWTKWKQYTASMHLLVTRGPGLGTKFPYTEARQSRECTKCGYKQDEEV